MPTNKLLRCSHLCLICPKNFSREILVDFENEEIVGSQIAGLTLIVKELVTALDAGALTEIVQAASGKHSEWWVVEALIVTLRKAKTPSELSSILNASRQIKNLDLRAKLAGRIAMRSADLGQYLRSIEIANSIEFARPSLARTESAFRSDCPSRQYGASEGSRVENIFAL